MFGIVSVILLLLVVGMLLPIVAIDDRIRRVIIVLVAVFAIMWLIGLNFGYVHVVR